MGKSVKERLDETIKRDKREIAEEDNKMGIKGNKETNVEDFMNKKIKEIVNFAFNKVSEINENKNSKKENTVIENEVTENSNSAVSHMDLTQCYDIVHYMANTIIIADDGQIWGQNEITREAVTQMVNELKGQDDYLSDELKKWLELDFSNGVEVHNYVWNKLGGNVGKAKALNEEKVEQVIKVMTE